MSNPDENVFVIRGGQGASKTISILELIIQALLASEKEATVLSSELSKMKRTVIRDYKKICKDWGVIVNDEDFNKSESKHDYRNSSYLDFLGADVNDVGKGFRRDILYINEADKMDIETAIQFISRAGLTIIDYNPDNLFWGDDFINENNFLTLTFEDNEYLSESELKAIQEYRLKGFHNPDLPPETLFQESNIKNNYWANKWKVYGLGLVGMLQGVVFENWDIVESLPYHEGQLLCELVAPGLDFGFTNDPTALINVYRKAQELWIEQKIYETRLINSDIINKLPSLNISPHKCIVADSAEPKSIEEISRAGYQIEGARKGQDSIRASIDTLQTFKIHILRSSESVIKEFKAYRWIVDKNGKALNEPVDKDNHAIDAIRYVALNRLGAEVEWTFHR